MNIRTIEQDYDWRMKEAIKKLLNWNEKTPEDFENGFDLMGFVWANRDALGEIIANDMTEWKDESEWFDEVCNA